jgi:hypothetical protein
MHRDFYAAVVIWKRGVRQVLPCFAPVAGFSFLLATCCVGSANADTSVFSDTEFPDGNWAIFEVIDETPNDSFTFSGTHSAAGGNPGAYRRAVNSLSTPIASDIIAGHLYLPGSFDPGDDGSFVSLDVSLDGIGELGGPAGAMAYGVLLQQDGEFFFSSLGGVVNGVGWQTLSKSGLVESDFMAADGVSQLDLSDTGSVLKVGVIVSNGTFGEPSVNTGGVDNWSLTITHDPVAAAPALSGLGLVTLAWFLLALGAWMRWRTVRV